MNPRTVGVVLSLAVLSMTAAPLPAAPPRVAEAEVYVSAPKDICFRTAATESGWGDCIRLRDELVLRPTSGSGYDVGLETVWTNGHSCSFHGTGRREGTRLVASRSGQPECPLVLEFRGDSVTTSYPGPGCIPESCGMRGTIDGIVLERVPCSPADGVRSANEDVPERCTRPVPPAPAPEG